MKYPPFSDIIVVSFNSSSEEEIKQANEWMYENLKKSMDEETFRIFKPMPAPIDKIQNRFRWRIIIKGNMTNTANEY